VPTIPRLYIEAALAPGATIAATPAQARHLGTVLRARAGDPVHLFNGRDGEWAARIATLQRALLALTVCEQRRPQLPESDLWLAFALLKRDTTDLVVQKATELGVAELHPVLSERTNAARTNLDRLAAIAVEAAEQCERLTVPVIHPPRPLAELLAAWPRERALYAAIERAAGTPPLRPRPTTRPAALLVGPEGGFTQDELEAMTRHTFVTPVSLGPRILRAETACVAGLALLQAPPCG